MTHQELLDDICLYDPQSPYYDEASAPISIPTNCCCDNCFYGRSRLAYYTLELIEILKSENIKYC